MKLFDWKNKSWRQRIILLLTIVAMIVLASHPELRLLLPLLDGLGLELLLLLIGSQYMDSIRPILHILNIYVIKPSAIMLYKLTVFMLGIASPPLEARVATYRLSRQVTS